MDNKELAIELAFCESESAVINILKHEGYWDNDDYWRPFGDNENNYSTIGNQQSDPAAALVEKIVNSIDAILMKECLKRGISPEDPTAPKSISEALETYFGIRKGRLEDLTPSERTKFAKSIILAATGGKPTDGFCPNITIVDEGEGQTPNRMPETILSINKSNKLKVPFVQGKFNMGGTGVLRFCGNQNIQLIISKRCPDIHDSGDETNDLWGVTVVRRLKPEETDERRSSLYQYLTDTDKRILSFSENNGLQIIPSSSKKNKTMHYGMFCKMFEYNMPSRLCSNINMSFYSRLSTLLPNLAYPIFIDECRDYKAHTMYRTVSGLNVRLSDNQSDEHSKIDTVLSANFTIEGQELSAAIYVFKKDDNNKASEVFSFGADEGIILTQNGQTHGSFDRKFYRRNTVGLSYLADSILTIVDCSNISKATREDLFMNSRDRLSSGVFATKLERELEDYFKNNPTLKALQAKRREEAIANKLDDEKPLEEVLNSVFKSSAVLSKLFVSGERLNNPNNLGGAKETEEFVGKYNPTFFEIATKKNELFKKDAQLGRKFRLRFKTDAVNDFFSREDYPGTYSLYCNGEKCDNHNMNLHNGTATLSVELPDTCKVGDELKYKCTITDNNAFNDFINDFLIVVTEFKDSVGGEGGRIPPSGEKDGKLLAPTGISLPDIIPVTYEEWDKYDFNKESALMIRLNDADKKIYDFYINMDNIHLQSEIKPIAKHEAKVKLLKARYKYSMVLIGLSVLGYYSNYEHKLGPNDSVEDIVEKYSQMISPVLLPMIDVMGSSDLQDIINE